MGPAAVGIRMHSGWGAVVALAREGRHIELLDRRRVSVAVQGMSGGKQPYHFVERLPLADAEAGLCEIAAAADGLAVEAMATVVGDLSAHGYAIESAAILLASPRTVPPLAKILASHASIHAAEGEFFRNVAWRACEGMHLHVAGFRERGLEEEARRVLGASFAGTVRELARVGKAAGPPWTADQKCAAWAAVLCLAKGC